MLKDHASSAIVPCTDLVRAKTFYGEILGLPLIADHGNGFIFRTGATRLNIYLSDYDGTNHANAVVWAIGGRSFVPVPSLRLTGGRIRKQIVGPHLRNRDMAPDSCAHPTAWGSARLLVDSMDRSAPDPDADQDIVCHPVRPASRSPAYETLRGEGLGRV